MAKVFPIQSETACQAKWTWSTIRLYNGTTNSCHRVEAESINVDNFATFHNTPQKLIDRKLMLAGQWPTRRGCDYCRDIEAAGGTSDRMFHNSIPGQVPPELDKDLTAISVTPRIVEIYFDNVCNLNCLYCWDGFSSRLQQENNLHGRFEKDGVVIENTAVKVPDLAALTQEFWQWLSVNHNELRRFHFLGGEPFFQPQFDVCMEFFEQHPCPELEFNIVSNLIIPEARFKQQISQIQSLVERKHLKRFDITASIDCFGPEAEYVRYGLDIDVWRKNFELLVSMPWITLNINQTLTALTLKTVPELLQYINKLRQDFKREIGHYFGYLVTNGNNQYLHPKVLGGAFFENDFQRILAEMPDNTWQQKQAKEYMEGLRLRIANEQRDQTEINRLVTFLNEIDRRRGTNWRKTFSWLENEC